MCKLLNMPRSTYYKAHEPSLSKRVCENEKYEELILSIYKENYCRYGAPKIHRLLRNQGFLISIKRVQRLMRKLKIKSIVCKKFRPYSSDSEVYQRKNIIQRDFTTKTINEKWVGDITYIHTLKHGWCYLASVMDLHTRKIIGYSFSRNMDTQIVLAALDNAYRTQLPNRQVIFHSDLGTQYTSVEFIKRLKEYNIIPSYSLKGCPYDNACIESFHSILKKEEVNNVQYYDFDSAKLAMFKFIEAWYNRKRIHGSIGYLTPQSKEDLAKASNL
jgi:putative transposase